MEESNRRRQPAIDADTEKRVREVPNLRVLPAGLPIQQVEQALLGYERTRVVYQELADRNSQQFEDYRRLARDPATTNYQRKGYVEFREKLAASFAEAMLAFTEVTSALSAPAARGQSGNASVANLNEMIRSQEPHMRELSSQLAKSQSAFSSLEEKLTTARIPQFAIETPVRERLLIAVEMPELLSTQQWRDQTRSLLPLGDKKFKAVEAGLQDYEKCRRQYEQTAGENARSLRHFEGELESGPPTERYLDYRTELRKVLDTTAASLVGLSDRLNELGEVRGSRQPAVETLRQRVRKAQNATDVAQTVYAKAADLVETIRAESQNKAPPTLVKVRQGPAQAGQGRVVDSPNINKPLPALPATPELGSRGVRRRR